MSAQNVPWRRMVGVLGVELKQGDARNVAVEEVLAALDEYHVVVFRDQQLSPDALAGFAATLGELDVYPLAEPLPDNPYVVAVRKEPNDTSNFGGAWHSDTSYLPEPPAYTVLYALEIPRVGGDTLFADMELAYRTLSPGMRAALERLTGCNTADLVHSAAGPYGAVAGQSVPARRADRITAAEHPIVRRHPRSGRPALYVSLIHTERFAGMTRAESLPLLEFLQRHAVRAEHTMRLRWRPGTLAIWDNRSVQHYALNDYPGERRLLHRVIVKGERPLAA